MKVLIPVDGSKAALSSLLHVGSLARSGVPMEALLLNVQPRFHRHVSQFTSRAARESLRAERSAAAMAPAIEALTRLRIPFRAVSEVGMVAQRIAAVAEREQVDEIVIGTGRQVKPSIPPASMHRWRMRRSVSASCITSGRSSREASIAAMPQAPQFDTAAVTSTSTTVASTQASPKGSSRRGTSRVARRMNV